MNSYIRKRIHKLEPNIRKEEENFLRWANTEWSKGNKTSEYFITQTFMGGIQPNHEKPVRDYILTFLLNLSNNIGSDLYAVGGSWNKASHNYKGRASHFHLMVSVPLVLPPSVVMRLGTQDKNGNKLSKWGRNTCERYDPNLGGFPYILTRHDWETFNNPFHPRG